MTCHHVTMLVFIRDIIIKVVRHQGSSSLRKEAHLTNFSQVMVVILRCYFFSSANS